MEKIVLNSTIRTGEWRLKDLRASKKIPAVVYGRKFTPVSISLDYSEFLKTFRVAGETHIIKLSIEWKNQDVLVYDIQYHPVSWDFQHVDFITVNAKEKLTVNIPLKLVGNSPAVREGWIVDHLVDEVEVKCLPWDLVDHFEFDISALLGIWDSAHLSDVNIDTKKFDIHLPLDTTIVSILEPATNAVEEEVSIAPSEVPTATEEKAKEEEKWE